MPRKLTKQDFVAKAKEIHGNKYGYKSADYKNNATKIEIICEKHGSFLQMPRDHLTGRGCMKCSLEQKSLAQRMSIEDFVARATKTHGEKYNYSLVQFTNNKSKIKVICPEHGCFEQTLSLHIFGSGCPECGLNRRAQTHVLSTDIFIDLSIKRHGSKYNYSITKYIGAKIPVKIKCKKHGIFSQKPNDHLDGHGCGKCAKNISNMETYWLDMQAVPKENRNVTIKIGDKRFYVDGYYNGIIYEFYGDFWHGNPDLYSPQDYCKVTKKTFGEMYNKTIERKSMLEKHGLTVVCEWEKDFRGTYEKLRNNSWRSDQDRVH